MDGFTIKRYNVKPVMERIYCPDCDVELEQDPVVLSSFPAQFQYFCPKCGYGFTSTSQYPQVTFVNEEEVGSDS